MRCRSITAKEAPTDNLLTRLNQANVTTPLREKRGSFVVDDTLGCSLLFASLFSQNPNNFAIVANNLYSAQRIYEFLLNFLNEDQVVFFPSDELLRAESLASGRELLSQRLYALGQLQSPKKKILVTHPAALLRYLPDPKRFAEETLHFKTGDHCDLTKLKARLVEMGYQGINKIEHSLEFASRGDILDVYSVSYLDPIRIEFFDDQIESIRTFDIQSQSSKSDLKECTILPATDIFLNDDELSDFMIRAKEQLNSDKSTLPPALGALLEQNVGLDLENFVTHDYKNELYKYYGFALQKHFSVLSYFDPEIVYIANKEQFVAASDLLINEAHDYFSDLQIKARIISHLEEYMPVEKAIPSKRNVIYSHTYATTADDLQFVARPIITTGTNIANIIPTIETYLGSKDQVVLALHEKHQIETVESFLQDQKIPFERVQGFDLPQGSLAIADLTLSEGFEIPSLKIAYLSANELFGHKIASSRFTSRFKDATILRSYEDLHPGDYVVHEYNGIGQFLGIKTIEQNGIHRDYLHIAYAGNEFLYVPLEQFRLVRKYAGKEGAAPRLSHLSSGEWEKKKAHIKARVNELADRLIALYGERAKISGFAFPPDDDLQKQFEDEFPYTLTADQQKSLDEIKGDMEKPEIMDRLLCGDVGFGKTEVAFRCAFKAILAGKQVALLCPTTLLARQHYEVALERFANYGVKIAVFSRLIPAATQTKNIKLIAEGKIDLVIGTHRLLSKDFKFRDLGLLIVDEEQRFGVEQKERIKEIKKNVDVLTLSATPIPRTLQMSLVGIRPLSQINTAPESRMPIQTYVTPFKEDVVTELIERELGRNGQVFYVHNVVETIYATASKLAAKVNGAKVGVVHGQMEKEEIEDVMEKFYDGELNVLVCTSIIENGIDIPNANMLIVEDADKFGLSQLYQIKGRVGRGNRIAYAYLMYKPQKDMNEDAQKRLQAIQEFTELGSGYKIAQRDLMIRGAGDILGPEQAGFIDSIGLDLYLKLLNEAVKEKQTGIVEAPPKPNKMFQIDAYIPKDYAIPADKIELYQELEDVKNDKDLAAFSKKIRDIYGRIPDETKLLIQKKRIDLLSTEVEFKSIDETTDLIDILLSDAFSQVNGIGADLFNALLPYLSIVKVSFLEKRLRLRITKSEKWLDDLEAIMTLIHKLYVTRSSQSL